MTRKMQLALIRALPEHVIVPSLPMPGDANRLTDACSHCHRPIRFSDRWVCTNMGEYHQTCAHILMAQGHLEELRVFADRLGKFLAMNKPFKLLESSTATPPPPP